MQRFDIEKQAGLGTSSAENQKNWWRYWMNALNTGGGPREAAIFRIVQTVALDMQRAALPFHKFDKLWMLSPPNTLSRDIDS